MKDIKFLFSFFNIIASKRKDVIQLIRFYIKLKT